MNATVDAVTDVPVWRFMSTASRQDHIITHSLTVSTRKAAQRNKLTCKLNTKDT